MLDQEIAIKFRLRSLLVWACFSPLIVVIGWWVWSWNWSSNNAPAWVQAVGSVAALLVTGGVALYQSRERLRDIQRHDRELMEKIASLAGWIMVVLRDSNDAIQTLASNQVLREFASKLDKAEERLAHLSFVQIRLIEAALGWEELRGTVSDMKHIVADAIRDGTSPESLMSSDVAKGKAEAAFNRIMNARSSVR